MKKGKTMAEADATLSPDEKEAAASEAAFTWLLGLLGGASSIRVEPLGAGGTIAGGFTIKLGLPEA
jgi:hypothetical protein